MHVYMMRTLLRCGVHVVGCTCIRCVRYYDALCTLSDVRVYDTYVITMRCARCCDARVYDAYVITMRCARCRDARVYDTYVIMMRCVRCRDAHVYYQSRIWILSYTSDDQQSRNMEYMYCVGMMGCVCVYEYICAVC